MKLPLRAARGGQPRIYPRLRWAVQIASLLVFLALFVAAANPGILPGFANLYYRLDPLVALTATLAGRGLLAGMALSALTIGLTVVFGRAWCGWLCPMGTVLDLFKPRIAWIKRPPAPGERWRVVKYLLLAFLIAAALFGNQTLLFLDPITILTRTLANVAWPALAYAVGEVEAFLYQFDFLWGALDRIHAGLVYPLFKDVVGRYNLAVPLLFFFIGLVGLNWVAERFWCRYLCPLGGLLGLVSRFALFRRVVDDQQCTACAACSHHCPVGTINPQRGYASDPAECTLCMDCLVTCPRSGISFRWQEKELKKAATQPYDPARREVLGAMGAAAAWAALTGVEPIRERQPANLIRPPGVSQAAFESLCIRCNACLRVCPTHGLQSSLLEGGWQNMLTPLLNLRLGACAYNCSACGEVCPTGAIPRLSLEDKRQVVIGLARVDRTRCLPWNYNIECIVCEETCPLPDKAIRLEVVETTNAEGLPMTIQRPYVVKELCIGCGMCEYKCPMGGEAAIRVFSPTETNGYF